MKIEEAIGYMSKMYLERILRSYTQDYPNKGENEYREIIKNNVDTLSNPKLINDRLTDYFFENKDPYSKQILYGFILKSLLSKTEYYADTQTIIDDVRKEEDNIIEASKSKDSFKHLDEDSIKIFSAILEVALEDEIISKDELALIQKLRKKLSINEKDQYLIQASLNLFPSTGNSLHTRAEITKVIDDLQKCGVLFCCNKHEEISETVYVIPEEIVPGVKESLGIELIEDKLQLLLKKLNNKQLRSILSSNNLNQGGAKDELVGRIIHAGIKPSDSLELLTSSELSDLCGDLPGLIKSGTKDEKIERVLDYFSNLVVKDIDDSDPREKYYEYIEELAARDLNNLLGNKIITKPNEIETAFEKGTRYLFEQKLNHALVEFDGNEHADGGVHFRDTESILLWDNKSKDDGNAYKFPDGHFRQFRRYIRNEAGRNNRVSCFLIIVPTINSSAKQNAVRLKAESKQDTDVALITAENLKMVAEDWENHSNREQFNLHIFNHTGILDRETLKERMKWHE